MYGGYVSVDPFEITKHKLSQRAKGLSNAMIGAVISTLVLVISVIVALNILGLTLDTLKTTDPYVLNDTFVKAMIPQLSVTMIFLAISGVTLIIFFIIIILRYFQLGSSFGQLHSLDPSIPNISNVSTMIISATIGIIIRVFLPGTVSTIVGFLCDVFYAIVFYQIYNMFNYLFMHGRFPKRGSTLLIIAFGIKLISDIINLFTFLSAIGLILFYIFAIIGFRSFASDILLITQGTTPTHGATQAATQAYVSPQQPYGYATTYPPQQPPQQHVPPQGESTPSQQSDNLLEPVRPSVTTENFCPKCGAKIEGEAKFCPYCGAGL